MGKKSLMMAALLVLGMGALLKANEGSAMPDDLKAARDKWLDARAQEAQASSDFEALKQSYEHKRLQACIDKAQAEGKADRVAQCKADLDRHDKVAALKAKILPIKLDLIAADRAEDKVKAKGDEAQIKEIQDEIAQVWQAGKPAQPSAGPTPVPIIKP
jgi:hypothetical protein